MKLYKSKLFYVFIFFVLAGGGYFYYQSSQNKLPVFTTVAAQNGRLIQTVSETGSIKTSNGINLNFLANGKLAKKSVKIGDKVKKDQVLAELDYSNVLIQQKQAQASLAVAQANLSKISNGASAQDIAVSASNVKQAQNAYQNAKTDLQKTQKTTIENIAQANKMLADLEATDKNRSTAGQAVLAAETALANVDKTYRQNLINRKATLLASIENQNVTMQGSIDTINRALTDENAKDTLSVQDASQLASAKINYNLAQIALTQSKSNLTIAIVDETKIADASISALSALNQVLTTLNYTFNALAKSLVSTKFPQSQLDTLKATISTQQATINAGISALQANKNNYEDTVVAYSTSLASAQAGYDQAMAALTSAIKAAKNATTNTQLASEQQVQSAKSRGDAAYQAWQYAEAQLQKTTAKARPEDIRLAEAQISQAQASVDAISNQIANSIIKAPIDGEITQVNYEIGEQPVVTKPVITMLSQGKFEIEVDISEADITKVKQGNFAKVTFDAFGDGIVFNAEVMFVEPAQTVIQDVVYYKSVVDNLTLATSTTIGTSTDYLAQIRPGMTANVIITTATRDNTLIVPTRAIVDRGGLKYTRLLLDKKAVEVPVVLGLRGDEGLVEILGGVKVGDLVITSSLTTAK
ncbi:MAG: HlyD family efflux transporter periplasmic adaptor subunit [Candidatus Falkowbacteria bacterium]